MDVCGLKRNISVGEAKHFVTFVDDFSRKMWVYMTKYKGLWFERYKEFQAFVEIQLEYEIKAFQWMYGGDFISKKI